MRALIPPVVPATTSWEINEPPALRSGGSSDRPALGLRRRLGFSDKVAMKEATVGLPGHDVVGGLTRTIEASSLAAAGVLLLANIAHAFSAGLLLHWWSPIVVVAAALAADLVSGLVHWTADTWFSEAMPVLGAEFLRPFRVHHVNPDDFLHRDVIDCNGDVAMLNIPILVIALVLPDIGVGGGVSLGTPGVCCGSLPTNQVHQWAHMPSPPGPSNGCSDEA